MYFDYINRCVCNNFRERRRVVGLCYDDGSVSSANTRPPRLYADAVLIDVFTFECINCVRLASNPNRLYHAYSRSDLAIVAVHPPEVPSYQSRISYVAQQAKAAPRYRGRSPSITARAFEIRTASRRGRRSGHGRCRRGSRDRRQKLTTLVLRR